MRNTNAEPNFQTLMWAAAVGGAGVLALLMLAGTAVVGGLMLGGVFGNEEVGGGLVGGLTGSIAAILTTVLYFKLFQGSQIQVVESNNSVRVAREQTPRSTAGIVLLTLAFAAAAGLLTYSSVHMATDVSFLCYPAGSNPIGGNLTDSNSTSLVNTTDLTRVSALDIGEAAGAGLFLVMAPLVLFGASFFSNRGSSSNGSINGDTSENTPLLEQSSP